MRYLYALTIVILLCTPKHWEINKSVKKMSLAEKEPMHELKGSDTEEFEAESFTTHMSLLSLSNTGKEEDENIEELGAVGGIGEMEELGAVGGIEEMEEIEDDWSSESESEYSRTRRGHKTRYESKYFEEHEGTHKKTRVAKLTKKQLREKKSEQSSSSQEYEMTHGSSVDKYKKISEFFVESIYKHNALLPSFSISLIQKYLDAGISGEERISKLHDEYPLNRCKKIDFKNLKFAFGTEVESLKNMNEDQLNDALFFDDFMVLSLSNFLKETKVGTFFLEEACSLYKEGYIKFIPCNLELLEYLTLILPLFDIDFFIEKNMGIYLGKMYNYFWTFWHKKIPLIRKINEEDRIILEQLKIDSTYRELTFEEIQELRDIFDNGRRNIFGIRKLLKIFEKRIDKINEDLGALLEIFPVNMKYLNRDELIITSTHYILSFCVQLIKPLYDKAQCNEYIEYDTFSNSSRSLNELLNHLEMLEFNSELYNIFCVLYPEFDKYYPRLNSFEEIIGVYNYLVVKLQFIVVIFDINKFLLKLYTSFGLVKYYRDHVLVLYYKILSDAEGILIEAKKMIKELT
ncbi:conserved Plasmodium protein, unknown function [Plasmodium ovale]|uniref:KELT protein n=2 Tax=Plasmodium ovale TaxID=36330 RepID=A0A1C3KWG8_PLAOA|nr:conserved Plasmodium protein, unknown function [Plasmodium ovale]